MAVHNIPCNWYRGAMAYAGVEIWSRQIGHKSMTFMVSPENLEEVSLHKVV